MEFCSRAEMENEPDFQARQSEIRQQLTLGVRGQDLGRLDLEDDLSIDDTIDSLARDGRSFVNDVYAHFAFDVMAAPMMEPVSSSCRSPRSSAMTR
jgi:hypothetical protein